MSKSTSLFLYSIASILSYKVWEHIGITKEIKQTLYTGNQHKRTFTRSPAWAVGYDNNNKEHMSRKIEVNIFEPQKPYNGTPASIPGKIEAEEYDFGGRGKCLS